MKVDHKRLKRELLMSKLIHVLLHVIVTQIHQSNSLPIGNVAYTYFSFGMGGAGYYKFGSLKAHANGRNKCQQLPTLLSVTGQRCCVSLHGPKSLNGFKLYATSANIVVVPCKRTQQVTTLLGPTMLGVVGQQCWVRLHGP